jgi:hypothetical protein
MMRKRTQNFGFKALRNIYSSIKDLECVTKSRYLEDKYAWQTELFHMTLCLIADVEYGLIWHCFNSYASEKVVLIL